MGNTPDETISWIKKNLSSDTPLRDMYLKGKNEIFVLWAEALYAKINDGSLDIPIDKVGREIRRELLQMGLDVAIVYMYEVIPAKFKHPAEKERNEYEKLNDEYNQEREIYEKDRNEHEKVGNPTKYSSVEETKDYSIDNQPLIHIANDLKNTANNLINYLQDTAVVPNCSVEWLSSVRKMTNAVMEKAKYTADGREKLCKLDQVLTLTLANSCTLNSIYDELTAQKMKQSTITSKQMGKIVAMKIKEAFETLVPQTEGEAIAHGWTGIPCEKCGEYRVERTYNSDVHNYMDHCVKCDNWQKMGMSPVINN